MSAWDDTEVRELRSRHAEADADLVLRVYSARLLGAQPDLGAPGMCSASLKAIGARAVPLLLIHPRGTALAGLAIEELRPLDLAAAREREPELNPDAALHAALPARFVDQTYPSAVLALASQPDAELRVRALLGARIGWLPWAPSLSAAARALAEICEKHPELEGIVLQGRGLLSFGDSARESFERALRIADRAEAALAERLSDGRILDARPVVAMREVGEVAHVLRGALAAATGELDRPYVHVVLEFRSSDEIAHFASSPLTPLLAAASPPSQAHARLVGGPALFVPAPPYADLRKLRDTLRREVEAYRRAWIASLERCAASGVDSGEIAALDPTPRAVLLPGLGLFGVGETRAQARAAAAGAEHAIRVKIRAVSLGQYEGIPEPAALEAAAAHLEAGARAPLTGQIALVAGGSECAPALARALAAAGAELVLVDGDAARLAACAPELDGAERLTFDLADGLDARDALRGATERLGGLDVLALDADELGEAAAEELVDQALALLAAQGTGGAIVLVARRADVTDLCQRAARQGAPFNVRVNGIALGPTEPRNLLRIPITCEHAARAAVFLAATPVPLTSQILLLDGGG
jgi:rhamnose utilization protein RhaD (predicted bifunctional aldolase and dehydrogenase)/NAD(P)-dependent dehydrogenase (short-subunit alcohol dehydrogenase family)